MYAFSGGGVTGIIRTGIIVIAIFCRTGGAGSIQARIIFGAFVRINAGCSVGLEYRVAFYLCLAGITNIRSSPSADNRVSNGTFFAKKIVITRAFVILILYAVAVKVLCIVSYAIAITICPLGRVFRKDIIAV